MQFAVLVEKIENDGYRATAGVPFAFTVEASTRDEVMRLARDSISRRLERGAELVQLEVPIENPWRRLIGIHNQEDPVVQEWKAIMLENRKKADEDDDSP